MPLVARCNIRAQSQPMLNHAVIDYHLLISILLMTKIVPPLPHLSSGLKPGRIDDRLFDIVWVEDFHATLAASVG